MGGLTAGSSGVDNTTAGNDNAADTEHQAHDVWDAHSCGGGVDTIQGAVGGHGQDLVGLEHRRPAVGPGRLCPPVHRVLAAPQGLLVRGRQKTVADGTPEASYNYLAKEDMAPAAAAAAPQHVPLRRDSTEWACSVSSQSDRNAPALETTAESPAAP